MTATEIHAVQFEKLQKYAAAEHQLQLTIAAAATQPSTRPATLPSTTPEGRLLSAVLFDKPGVQIVGWSEFVNWELLNSDEIRLQRFARHIGADYVIVASASIFKTSHNIYRPQAAFLDTVAPPPAHPGFFAPARPKLIWWQAGGFADRYFYDVIFLRKTPAKP